MKKSKTNITYFQDIPKPEEPYNYAKLQDIIKEKAYLNRMQEIIQDKNREYIKAEEVARQLNLELRRLKDKEIEQRNKIINLIPNKVI